MAKVHDALDERQRTLMADFVRSGSGWGYFRHASSQRSRIMDFRDFFDRRENRQHGTSIFDSTLGRGRLWFRVGDRALSRAIGARVEAFERHLAGSCVDAGTARGGGRGGPPSSPEDGPGW